jgi:uncharacterized protein (PEP-CTERM system associated)
MVTATAVERLLKPKRLCVLLVAVGISVPVNAASGQFTPAINFIETYTDNVDLVGSKAKGDWVSELAPQLRFDGTSARAKWNFDYQRHELAYSHDKTRNSAQNLLNAFGTLEAGDKWLYVDGRGSVTQQTISAFGVQAPSNVNVTKNRAETSTYQLSPYIRGSLGGTAGYQLRYNWTNSRSDSAVLSDVRTREWVGDLNGKTTFSALLWSVQAGSQRSRASNGLDTVADHVRGSLSYQFDPQFRMSLIGGREANDYATLTKKRTNTNGFGLDWAPAETTSISAMKEKRFFGNGHTFSFKHRTPLSAWEYSDNKDVTILPSQLASASVGTIYDLLNFIYTSQFPDPVQRGQVVRQYLQAQGIPENTQVISGFLTSTTYVERAQQASIALLGARNTVTFVAMQSDRQSLSNVSNMLGDFANSSDVLQRGLSTRWAHKLSAVSALTLALGWTQTIGSGLVNQESKQRRLDLLFATQWGPKTFFSLGARRMYVLTGGSSGYRENALTGALTIQF